MGREARLFPKEDIKLATCLSDQSQFIHLTKRNSQIPSNIRPSKRKIPQHLLRLNTPSPILPFPITLQIRLPMPTVSRLPIKTPRQVFHPIRSSGTRPRLIRDDFIGEELFGSIAEVEPGADEGAIGVAEGALDVGVGIAEGEEGGCFVPGEGAGVGGSGRVGFEGSGEGDGKSC